LFTHQAASYEHHQFSSYQPFAFASGNDGCRSRLAPRTAPAPTTMALFLKGSSAAAGSVHRHLPNRARRCAAPGMGPHPRQPCSTCSTICRTRSTPPVHRHHRCVLCSLKSIFLDQRLPLLLLKVTRFTAYRHYRRKLDATSVSTLFNRMLTR
jgi:hypothetical protein